MDKWANHSSNIYHNWSPGDILILDKDHNKTNDKHNKQLIIYHCSPEHIQGTYRGSAQWVFNMPNSDQYKILSILIFGNKIVDISADYTAGPAGGQNGSR